jgi:predicted dienelactone hydrolase
MPGAMPAVLGGQDQPKKESIMAKHNMISAACAALILFATTAAGTISAEQRPGVINFTFDAPHRDRLVQAAIWYPAEGGGYRDWIGDNPVFRGVLGWRDAKPEVIKHPLIIISHGSGGNPANLSWIASRLASAGYIVALPIHQGTTSSDSTPEQTVRIWERTADLTALLDELLARPSISKLVDEKDITAMGFSLGGLTALSTVGVRAQSAPLAAYCDLHTENPSCIWLDRGTAGIKGHVNLHEIDAVRFQASATDERFTRFVVIDPAFTNTYDAQSLAAVTVPGLVVSMGEGNDVPEMVRADKLQQLMLRANFEPIPGANHFSFLAECKPLAFFYLWMEEEDPICTETGNQSRSALHEAIAQKILTFLKGNES